MKLCIFLLLSLSPSLLVWSGEPAPVRPPAGSSAEAWSDYNNAVAAWNQREAAASRQAAQAAAVLAAQAQARAAEAARASAQAEFERKQLERLLLQQQFRDQQQQQSAIRLMDAQTLLLLQRLQRR